MLTPQKVKVVEDDTHFSLFAEAIERTSVKDFIVSILHLLKLEFDICMSMPMHLHYFINIVSNYRNNTLRFFAKIRVYIICYII